MPSPPLLVLPSSSFLLFSSKFSCVIPSPRTPLISPLPACLRNTGRAKRDGERRRTKRRGMTGETGSGERELKRARSEKKMSGVGGVKSDPPSSIVAWEEKTRAFLVIASSVSLFEAQGDKRAAIYWSSHIMATFIYFRPFSFCQGLSSVWAKNRNPRCFTKYRAPSPSSIYVRSLFVCWNQTPQNIHKTEKSECRGEMYPLVNMWAHLYVTCLQSSPRPGASHTHRERPLLWHQKGQRFPARPWRRWPSVLRRARWPRRSSPPLTFCRELSLLPDLRQTAAPQANSGLSSAVKDYLPKIIRRVLVCLRWGFSFISLFLTNPKSYKKLLKKHFLRFTNFIDRMRNPCFCFLKSL